MRYPDEHISEYRRQAGELENEVIDEFQAGRLTRRELFQRGSVLGMSIPFLTLLAAGPEAAFAAPRAVSRSTAGTLRIGGVIPDGSLEPPLLQSLGALSISHIPGEQLVFANKSSVLVPRLATSWKSSNNAKRWTFQIRQGVKFHDGTPLTTDDVVATFERLLGPNSQAQSSYKGVIGGVSKGADGKSVVFDLEAPFGLFPYLTGQMTYQSIILPKSYQIPADLTKPGEWTSKMNGTGPFMLKENRGAAGFTFTANPNYWGGKPSIDTVELQVLEDQPRVTALQSGQIDLAVQISYQGAQQLKSSGQTVIPSRTANHRLLNMNVNVKPFNDPRVRQAIALALNRPDLVKGLWGPYAEIGNDSPMWPGYVFTDKTVPQRHQDIAKAKALLKAAGATNLKLTLTCYRSFEMPDYAQRVAQALKKIGINCSVKVYTSAQYFDGVSFGAKGKLAPWLSTNFGIIDYGGRPIPTTYLGSALKSGGVWNSSRYHSKVFDKALANFVAAPDLAGQKKYARQMQTILLKDTPAIYAYFYNFIAGSSPKVKGYVPDGLAVINLRGVTIG
jgi:peptide/nickel transport system substrate-binding protein